MLLILEIRILLLLFALNQHAHIPRTKFLAIVLLSTLKWRESIIAGLVINYIFQPARYRVFNPLRHLIRMMDQRVAPLQ